MSAISSLELLISMTKRLTKKPQESLLWRRLRDNARDEARLADNAVENWQNLGACEGSLEEILCEEEPPTIEELIDCLEKLGDRRQLYGLTNGREKTGNVRKMR